MVAWLNVSNGGKTTQIHTHTQTHLYLLLTYRQIQQLFWGVHAHTHTLEDKKSEKNELSSEFYFITFYNGIPV